MSRFATPAARRLAALALSLCVAAAPMADACTGIRLTAEDGSVIHARTGEFGTPLDLSMLIVPRGMAQSGGPVDGAAAAEWTVTYGFGGTNAHGKPALLDGLNEAGLAAGGFYFPEYAQYADVTADDDGEVVHPIMFVNWLLGNFATVDEVRAGLDGIRVAGAPLDDWGGIVPPFHWVVHDAGGTSIVIEPVGGALVVHDNPLGVMSNAPTFDWHMTNLRNFVFLDPLNVPPVTLDGTEFDQLGQGSGLAGLPGDFTPPSRFVRAAVFSQTAAPSPTGQDAVEQAFHILNQFDIPEGAVVAVEGAERVAEITQATIASDTRALRIYMHSHDSRRIQMLDLRRAPLDGDAIVQIDLPSAEVFDDVTPMR